MLYWCIWTLLSKQVFYWVMAIPVSFIWGREDNMFTLRTGYSGTHRRRVSKGSSELKHTTFPIKECKTMGVGVYLYQQSTKPLIFMDKGEKWRGKQEVLPNTLLGSMETRGPGREFPNRPHFQTISVKPEVTENTVIENLIRTQVRFWARACPWLRSYP